MALTWLVEQGEVERAGRLVEALRLYALLRLRPDVLAWAERSPPRPRRPHPRRRCCGCRRPTPGWPATSPSTGGAPRPGHAAGGPGPIPAVAIGLGSETVRGPPRHLRWCETSVRRPPTSGAPAPAPGHRGAGALARTTPPPPTTPRRCSPRSATTPPLGAYAWYCAGEADLADRARATSAERAVELTRRTGAAFVRPGRRGRVDRRPRRRPGRGPGLRGLIDHWRQGCGPRSACCGRSPACSPGRASTGRRRAGRRRQTTDAGHASSGPTRRRSTSSTGACGRARDGLAPRGAIRRRCRRGYAPGPARRRTSPARSLREDRRRPCSSSWVSASFAGWKPPQRTSR